MSRCFPYPPPGYTLSKASNDALIESIKLQKDKEKARTEKKKDRKREKKDMKREKEKKKEVEKRQKGSNISHEAYGVIQKVRKEENEQLERSGITEEHELLGNFQDPSNSGSSDSTQNSNKRKRHESPANVVNTGGNILRFRLASQKQTSNDISSGRIDSSNRIENAGTSGAPSNKLHPVSLPTNSTVRPPSQKQTSSDINSAMFDSSNKIENADTSRAPSNKLNHVFFPTNSTVRPPSQKQSSSEIYSGMLDSSNKVENVGSSRAPLSKLHNAASCPIDSTVRLLPVGTDKEPSQSTSLKSGNPEEKHHHHISKKSKKQHKAAKKYAKLIDCIPSRQTSEVVDCDEEWLCTKNLLQPDGKVQTQNQMSCGSSCLSWPRAYFLQEADIFALPYSIPF